MSSSSIGNLVFSGGLPSSSNGGLGAGIDVAELVQDSMAQQNAELTTMQGQQTTLTNEQTALSSINTDLQALQTAAQQLTDPVSQLDSMAVQSSNPDALTATALNGSSTAAHTISITNLATTASNYSDAVASASTVFGDGTLTIQVGSNAAQTITVNAANNDDTMTSLAAAINNTPNIGVTASVITDANGARLSIVSNTTGAPGALTITSTPDPDSTTTPALPGFHTAVAGVNANLTIDGILIASTSNTVANAINGVTLSLLAPTAANAPVTLSVGPDTSSAATAIGNFVTAYNTVVNDFNAQFTLNATTGEQGPLAADSTISLAQSQILSAAAFATSGNGTINSLGDLGLTMNNDGTLSINSGALATALQGNFSAVQNFFSSLTTGSFGANLANQLTAIADPVSGSIAQDLNGLANSQTSLTQQISDFQDQLSATQQQLTDQYNQVNVTLQELPLLLAQTTQQLSSLTAG
ncbi:MAG TPA: flagellar filament capping protein FliD [Candidatus Sulfotelmatobacter sp.]|nr:flagellar filament capping protein FliD [Candidatus Sulfotelmatobacter sp.]